MTVRGRTRFSATLLQALTCHHNCSQSTPTCGVAGPPSKAMVFSAQPQGLASLVLYTCLVLVLGAYANPMLQVSIQTASMCSPACTMICDQAVAAAGACGMRET